MMISTSKEAVVVHDPREDAVRLPEGEILSGNAIGVAQAAGVELLPIDLDALRRGGVCGWSKRSFGRGWKYEAVAGSRGCPLVLYAFQHLAVIEWVARLQLSEGEIENVNGSLRFAADTAQAGASAVGIAHESSAIQIGALGPPDEHDGWTVRGRGRLALTGDVMLGLQLYGQTNGVRVTWFAASQTR